MKIFFIARGLHDLGGLERVTLVIADELAKRGYQTGIVCLESGEPFFKVNPDVQIFYLPDEKTDSILPEKLTRKKRLRHLYQREKPDIVVFVGSHRSLLNIPAAKGIPGVTWEHFNANINWHPLHKLSRKLAVKHSAKIVTLTRRDADNYAKIFHTEKAVCIHNPLTIDNLKPSPRAGKRVLAAGRLAGQKGFDMLLDAWAKVENRKNGWKLRIVGSGKHLERLQEQIRQNGIQDSVEIFPATKNIVAEYEQASLLVMSSRYEGFGLVLVEGMAAGLPIVSFDCEAGPSEIVENGKTGILVPPNDVDKLAEALDKVMSDEALQNTFAQNALESVKRFSTESILPQWERLFNEIMTKNNGKTV